MSTLAKLINQYKGIIKLNNNIKAQQDKISKAKPNVAKKQANPLNKMKANLEKLKKICGEIAAQNKELKLPDINNLNEIHEFINNNQNKLTPSQPKKKKKHTPEYVKQKKLRILNLIIITKKTLKAISDNPQNTDKKMIEDAKKAGIGIMRNLLEELFKGGQLKQMLHFQQISDDWYKSWDKVDVFGTKNIMHHSHQHSNLSLEKLIDEHITPWTEDSICVLLLASSDDIIEKLATSLNHNDDENSTKATLFNQRGLCFLRLGKVDHAINSFVTASRLIKPCELQACILHNLGDIYIKQRKLGELFVLAKRIKEIRLEASKNDPEKAANTWGDFAMACGHIPGKENEAKDGFKKAIEISQKAKISAVYDKSKFADFLSDQGNYETSLRLYEKEIIPEARNENDPLKLFRIVSNYIGTCNEISQNARSKWAINILTETYNNNKGVFKANKGKYFIEFNLTYYRHLSDHYYAIGDFNRTIDIINRTMQVKLKRGHYRYPNDYVDSLYSLAMATVQLKNLNDAKCALHDLLVAVISKTTIDLLLLVRTLNLVGMCHNSEGQPERAIITYKSALFLLDHIKTTAKSSILEIKTRTLINYAAALIKTDKLNEASERLKQARMLAMKITNEHLTISQIESYQAKIFLYKKSYEAGIDSFDKAKRILIATYPNITHPDILFINTTGAELYLKNKKYNECEKLCVISLNLLRTIDMAEKAQLIDHFLITLAKSYFNQENHTNAYEVIKKWAKHEAKDQITENRLTGYLLLAKFAVIHGDFKLGIEAYQKAIQADKDKIIEGKLLYGIGQAHHCLAKVKVGLLQHKKSAKHYSRTKDYYMQAMALHSESNNFTNLQQLRKDIYTCQACSYSYSVLRGVTATIPFRKQTEIISDLFLRKDLLENGNNDQLTYKFDYPQIFARQIRNFIKGNFPQKCYKFSTVNQKLILTIDKQAIIEHQSRKLQP